MFKVSFHFFTYLASNDLFKISVQKVTFLRNTTLNYLVGHRLTRHLNGEYLSENDRVIPQTSHSKHYKNISCDSDFTLSNCANLRSQNVHLYATNFDFL